MSDGIGKVLMVLVMCKLVSGSCQMVLVRCQMVSVWSQMVLERCEMVFSRFERALELVLMVLEVVIWSQKGLGELSYDFWKVLDGLGKVSYALSMV